MTEITQEQKFIDSFPLLGLMRNNGEIPHKSVLVSSAILDSSRKVKTRRWASEVQIHEHALDIPAVNQMGLEQLMRDCQRQMLTTWLGTMSAEVVNVTDDMRHNALWVITPEMDFKLQNQGDRVYDSMGERYYYDGMRVMVDQLIPHSQLLGLRGMQFWNLSVMQSKIERLHTGEVIEYGTERNYDPRSKFFIRLIVSGIFYVPLYWNQYWSMWRGTND